MRFEWDSAREIENKKKHGFGFDIAVEAFLDDLGFVLEDVKHSFHESRFYWVGKDSLGRVLTVRFVRRGNLIRI